MKNIKIGYKTRQILIFATGLYLWSAVTLLIIGLVSRGGFQISSLWFPLIPTVLYLVWKMFRRPPPASGAKVESAVLGLTFGFKFVMLIVSNVENALLSILVVVIMSFVWFAVYQVIKARSIQQFGFAKTLLLIPYFGLYLLRIIFSKRWRLGNQEYSRISKIMYQDCDYELLITEAETLLSRRDALLTTFERLELDWLIANTRVSLGDDVLNTYRVVVEKSENQKMWRMKLAQMYDSLIAMSLRCSDLVAVGHYQAKYNAAMVNFKTKDKLFPYHQGLLAYHEKRYEDALAYFLKRQRIFEEKIEQGEYIATNSGKAYNHFDIACTYEKLGKAELQIEALLIVAECGNKLPIAITARAKLTELGVEVPMVEEVELGVEIQAEHTTVSKPKPVNITFYLIVLLMVIGVMVYFANR